MTCSSPCPTTFSRTAISADPKNANAEVLLAQTLIAQNRLAEAQEAIDRVKPGKDEPVALADYVVGDLLARANRVDEAIIAFKREIANFPRERQTYGNLAVIYALTGRAGEANATMELLVRNIPERESYLFAAKTFDQIHEPRLAAAWRARAH